MKERGRGVGEVVRKLKNHAKCRGCKPVEDANRTTTSTMVRLLGHFHDPTVPPLQRPLPKRDRLSTVAGDAFSPHGINRNHSKKKPGTECPSPQLPVPKVSFLRRLPGSAMFRSALSGLHRDTCSLLSPITLSFLCHLPPVSLSPRSLGIQRIPH